MEKILSLDLGSNSNGWLLRDTSFGEGQLRKFGVITFETGVGKDDKGKFTVSFAAQRTQKRSIRRLYQARKYKLWTVLEVLRKQGYCPIAEESLLRWKHYDKEEAKKGNGGRVYPVGDVLFANWVKLNFNNDDAPDYKSPYQLRLELVTTKLDLSLEENRHKLGRALYHIAQHRGFKSSKKVQTKDEGFNPEEDFIGAERKRSKAIADLMEAHNVPTVGAAFAHEEKAGRRIRQTLHKDVLRKQLQDEVKKIFQFQALPVDDEFYGTVAKAMFWQRPLRSQKGSVGKCTLEPNKYRCPVSHPDFEAFRAWSFLNNIKYRVKEEKGAQWHQLPLNMREEIYVEKFFRTSRANFDFYEITQWIKQKNGHDKWELNYNYKTNVAACPVSAGLKSVFGEEWETININHPPNEKRKTKKEIYTIEDIWHVLFSSDDDDFIREFAINALQLDEVKTKKFISLWFSMPVDYGNLSLKAIRNILPFLKPPYGLIYTEAVLLAKLPEIFGAELWERHHAQLIENISTIIEQNRSDKKRLGIVNQLIAQYKALAYNERFADRNFDYEVAPDDRVEIRDACEQAYGPDTWKAMAEDEKQNIFSSIEADYQNFFFDKERAFKKMPHLLDTMKEFLKSQFPFLRCTDNRIEGENGKSKCAACRKLSKLYHPSQIEIYPPAKEQYYEDVKKHLTLLGSPKNGALKNPMAMRALHELRKFINYLIKTEQVSGDDTRIVIELARELNDNNKRWAIEAYQKRRQAENEEFAAAIRSLLSDPDAQGALANPDNVEDIDKFRLWYEMIEGEDAIEVSEDKGKLEPLSKEVKLKSKKGKEEEYEVFSENVFDKVNKALYFKLKKAKDDVVTKYRLWREQDCRCIYTGKIIRITDLFKPLVVDFEHTIPRSMSFDSRLENLTICDFHYNRHVKKNRIPTSLENYEHDTPGYTAIKPRLEKWEKKVQDLELHVEFWKAKAGRATDKKMKDDAIRQKHLWQFELGYWRDKLARFTMQEVKSGFKSSQLVDTQIISKYALHYLKTVFNKVEVQKGSVTADFRKIFGIQSLDERKDRSKHSHHAKDALVLSLIPTAALRERMLELWYKIDEEEKLLPYTEANKRSQRKQNAALMREQLDKLVRDCRLPDVNAYMEKIDERILINNVTGDQTLTPANRRVRKRGKIVGLKDEQKRPLYQTDENGQPIQRTDKQGNPVFKNDEKGQPMRNDEDSLIPIYLLKEKWAKGSAVRGRLHQDTFYGKIKPAKWNKEGRPQKDAEGNWLYNEKNEGFVFVVRQEVNKELKVENIVDPILRKLFLKQMAGRSIEKTLKEDGGIFMLNRKGEAVHKVRHVRCVAEDVTAPLKVKRQTYASSKEYKNFYWAKNAENTLYAFYWDGKQSPKGYECLNLYDLTEARETGSRNSLADFFASVKHIGRGKSRTEVPLYAVLKPGLKVMFYREALEELRDLDQNELNKRIYNMNRIFDSKQGLIQFQHHLEARDDKQLASAYPKQDFGDRGKNGFSEFNFEFPWPKLLLSSGKFNFAIEGKHFKVNPDGEIEWLFY